MTPAVERALGAARRYAAAGGEAEVRPWHLLAGLLEEEEGRAAVRASSAGLDLGAFRGLAPAAGGVAGSGEGLPLHPLSVRALGEARRLAAGRTGERTADGESLLLALLRADEGLRGRLEALGLRFGELEEMLGERREPPPEVEEPVVLADVTERVGAGRVLDAGANRAREALRVLEDYARFVLDDVFLTRELKGLRHDLTSALAGLAPELLLGSRETLQDVGTRVSARSERERASLGDVLRANASRLQEALRSLEEFGKVVSPVLGEAVERLRYRSYTLERALVLGAGARERLKDARLYVLLSAGSCASALDWTIAEAAAGGAGVVQLREKGLSDRELLGRARQVRRWTRRAGVLFIVNDRPDVARLAGADGVHLGQDDLPVREARRVLGPEALIGVSTHNVEQLRAAVLDGASYVGVGPTFASGTKEFGELAGLEFVRAAAAETTLPAFVIGGVNAATVGAVVAAGARRVAVGEAVARAEDPRAAAAELLRALAEEDRVTR